MGGRRADQKWVYQKGGMGRGGMDGEGRSQEHRPSPWMNKKGCWEEGISSRPGLLQVTAEVNRRCCVAEARRGSRASHPQGAGEGSTPSTDLRESLCTSLPLHYQGE